MTYAWDFDCDGATDSTLENPAQTFETAGNYTVLLVVTDSDGSTDTLMKTSYITVNSASEISECSNSPIKRADSLYSTLQSAYAETADGENIKLHDTNINTSLNINRDLTVTLDGGYNCDYSGADGMTTINGNITISSGTLIIGNVILE